METVLITGANRGLGLGLVRRWRAAGSRVLACCRRPEAAVELAREAGPGLSIHRLDVTDPSSIAALVRDLDGIAIDVLVHNAGIFGRRDGQRLGVLDFDAWRSVMETNLLGPMRVTEALLPNVAASRRRWIAAITSQMGSVSGTSGGSYAYRSSKAALNMAMRSLAADLASRRISVVLVHPGWVRTGMGGHQAALEVEESAAGVVDLLGRLEPGDSGHFFDWQGNEIPW
ncbi:MAG TPA: SDR family oxidoreductase [Thermoanaerobaculia bacterium]|nr:SDR family oxidoreductase [Thermoanaerobaculia bacterium]